MAEEAEPKPETKPITDDPDEQELLTSMGIPLTDPNPKTDEDDTPVAAAETEDPAAKEEKEPETPAAEATTEEEQDPAPEAKNEDAAKEKPDPEAKKPPTVEERKPPAQPHPDPLDAQIAALEATIQSDEFDPYSAEGKQAQIQHNRLCAKAEVRDEARRQAEVDATFEYARSEYKVEPDRAKNIWKEEYAKAEAKYQDPKVANAVATERWLDRLTAIKNGSKGPEAKDARPRATAPTPITAAGAKVAPPSRTGVPPAPRAKTDEEELVEHQRKYVPGGIKSLVR